MAAQLSSTLAALLAATNRRSPGRAWADLLMAALCAVVILGVSSSGLRARACGSAFFCALQQDHFLQQGAEGAAGPLAAARRGSGASALGRSGGALALCASARPTRARRAKAAAAAAAASAASYAWPAGTSGLAGGGDGRRLAAGAAAAHAREAERGARVARAAEVGGARGSALLEVPAGGLPPAVGGEGGCPRLLLIPGRVLIKAVCRRRALGLVSGAAGAASFFFEWPQVWGAGGAAAAAKAEGGCLPLPSGPGRARFYVTSECQSPEPDSVAVAAASISSARPQDRRAGEAEAVEMLALAAVGRAGAEAGRGGGRDGGAAGDGRLASWASVGWGGDVGVGSGWAPEWEWWCDCSCGAGDGF